MDCNATRIPYRQTNAFSRIVLDYIDGSPALKPFYTYAPSIQGIAGAIEARKKFKTDRHTLVQVLQEEYESVSKADAVMNNIRSLGSENTFTVTTGHQNNLFTGPLYFIYKIIHTIKLSNHLKELMPSYDFVPVYYMGTEDADLAELNHIYLGGEKLEWNTTQTGAVGRMVIDKALVKLIDRMEGQLSVLPFGNEIIEKLKKYYREGARVKDATFQFVHDLFGEYGLVILMPDNAKLKKQMQAIFKDDLINQSASRIVEQSARELEELGYKIQANPREVNVFYLKDNSRERLEKISPGTTWRIVNNKEHFNEEELLEELESFPGRFSPNVILRGLYQETVLPNVAFIGGGGETAYWLQLKNLFEFYQVPFPVLVLRNSFLIVEDKWRQLVTHLGFNLDDLFLSEQDLVKKWVTRETKVNTRLNGSLIELEKLYEVFKDQATKVDGSLEKHVEALKARTVSRLHELEKKMLRAEKRKYMDQQRQIHKVKSVLFPRNGLQERYDNLCYYYSLAGRKFITMIYDHSPALEQEFTVIEMR